jgi:WD40 repeat protein
MQRNYIEILRAHWERRVLDKQEKIASQLALYVPTSLGASENVVPELRIEAPNYIVEFLESDKRLLLLLGDSGSGKSLFCHWLVNELWRDQEIWLPLFIDLPGIKVKKSFLEKYMIKNCHLLAAEVGHLKENVNLLLILDAYDEMKIKYQQKNLYQLAELYNWKVKVILTCRTEAVVSYTLDQQQEMFQPYYDHITPMSMFWDKSYIQFFDPFTQIPQYIKLWNANRAKRVNDNVDYLKALKALPGISEMITNPFILSIVMYALPSLFEKYADLSKLERFHLTRLELFDTFVSVWFERQKQKLLRCGLIDNICAATIVEDYKTYCQQLATFMWQMKISTIRYAPGQNSVVSVIDLVDSTSALNSNVNLLDGFFAAQGNFNDDPKKPLALIRQGALLRIFQGNTYAFLHHSLRDYFSAKRLFQSAANKASISLGLEINAQLFCNNALMIGFGVDCVQQDPHFEQSLWDILQESKHEARVDIAAANAISILVAAKRSFAYKDLRRCRIPYANLAGGNFEGTDFREADLRDVNFSQAWLLKATLSGSCLDRLQTGEIFGEEFQSNIQACAFSPDGRYYIVMTENSIVVYEPETHKRLTTLFPPLKPANKLLSLSFSPNSASVLLGTLGGKILLLSFPEGKALNEWPAQKNSVKEIIVSPDGNWALSMDNKIIQKLDFATGTFTATGQYGGSALAINSNGQWALTGGDRLIRRWDCATGSDIAVWKVPTESEFLYLVVWPDNHNDLICEVNALAVSPDGRWALSGSTDPTIYRWDCETGQCTAKWKGHTKRILNLVISQNGSLAISGSDDNTIKRWDCVTGQCVETWQARPYSLKYLASSPDSRWMVSGGYKQLSRWDCGTFQAVSSSHVHSNKVTTLAINLDGLWALTGSSDATIKRWDLITGACIATWQGHTKTINALVITNDGCWAFSGSNDGAIKLWVCKTGRCVATIQGHNNGVKVLALTQENTLLFGSKKDDVRYKKYDMNATRKNDIIKHRYLSTFKAWEVESASKRKVNVIVLSADGRWMLSGDSVGGIRRSWIVSSDYGGRTPYTWEASHARCINALITSNDNTLALSAANDAIIKFWDIKTGECLAAWKGHSGFVKALVLSRDEEWLVSSDNNFNVFIWRISTGEIVQKYSFTSSVLRLGWIIVDPIIQETSRLRRETSALIEQNNQLKYNTAILIEQNHQNKLEIRALREKLQASPSVGVIENIAPDLASVGVEQSQYNTIATPLEDAALEENGGAANSYGVDLKVDIIMGMKDGSISGWAFKATAASLILVWRSKPWGLLANECQLLGVHGLSEQHTRVFLNKGSVVKVSSKPSDGVLMQRNHFQPFNAYLPPRSVFDPLFIVRPEAWVVSIVRRKRADAGRHAFIILESIEDGYYRLRRIDFLLEQRHRMISQDSLSGQVGPDIFGQALIEVADKSIFDMQSLVVQCCALSSGVSREMGIQLLRNIENDQKAKIGYCLMGAGSLYRMFRMKDAVEHHNCWSWSKNHLETIGVNLLNKTWIDGVLDYPPLTAEEDQMRNTHNPGDSEPVSGSKCLLM